MPTPAAMPVLSSQHPSLLPAQHIVMPSSVPRSGQKLLDFSV